MPLPKRPPSFPPPEWPWPKSKRTKRTSCSSDPDFEAAYAQALKLLKTRDRFSGELRSHLSKHFTKAVISLVLERLIVHGLQSDERLVRQFALANQGKRAVSARLLRDKLAAKGASEEALNQLDEAFVPELQPLLARFSSDAKDRARAGRFLASKGFEEDAIEAALSDHFGPLAD